jgi:hypothetical protein
MLRIPHCLHNRLIDGGKVVSLTHPPHFTSQKHYYFNVSGTHFCNPTVPKLKLLFLFKIHECFFYNNCSWYSDWLRPGRLRGRSSSPSMVKNVRFVVVVQTGSGAHLASYPTDTCVSFPGDTAAGP